MTVEVVPAGRRVVQARGLRNGPPGDDDRRLIEAWAKAERLTVEPFVFAGRIARVGR